MIHALVAHCVEMVRVKAARQGEASGHGLARWVVDCEKFRDIHYFPSTQQGRMVRRRLISTWSRNSPPDVLQIPSIAGQLLNIEGSQGDYEKSLPSIPETHSLVSCGPDTPPQPHAFLPRLPSVSVGARGGANKVTTRAPPSPAQPIQARALEVMRETPRGPA
ncbi:hypothetical protein E2C01_058828 [Portunus trituberculatus]|uniref:Uncharacterized protein n=1 Tax=Portunus trituberculatus TaxID=210409 RepID=A0A5B7H6I9_PORTR|nr:hypothetical protein [Portunus trituberculatus]